MNLARSDYNKQYYEKNKDVIKARSKQWAKNNRIKHNKNFKKWAENNPDYYLKKRYGLTQKEYDDILKKQNGICAICGKEETTKDYSGKIRALSVDHNHITGEIRGLLCAECNSAIGKFKDDINLLEKAIEYLRRYE